MIEYCSVMFFGNNFEFIKLLYFEDFLLVNNNTHSIFHIIDMLKISKMKFISIYYIYLTSSLNLYLKSCDIKIISIY